MLDIPALDFFEEDSFGNMDGTSKNFELSSGDCGTEFESFRRLRNRDATIPVEKEYMNDHGTTEEAGGSRRYVDVHNPVPMDETKAVSGNPFCELLRSTVRLFIPLCSYSMFTCSSGIAQV